MEEKETLGGQLCLGLEEEFRFTVDEAMLTDVRGGLREPVLATPAMIAVMERTAASLVAPLLPLGRATVGFHVDVKHVGSVGEGARCIARARLGEIADGRKLRFDVEVVNAEDGRVLGVGHHERRIVEGR